MKKSRSLTAAAAALVFAAGLVGCGSSTQAQQSVPGCPDGLEELTVLRASDAGNAPTDQMLEAYEQANKCVKFTVTQVPFGQLAQKINVLASSDNVPDIVGYDSPDTQNYASLGLLAPLDKYLATTWGDDVLPQTKAEVSYNGAAYSPGLQTAALVLFYNKSMTDAAGITPPDSTKNAWTWPEALEAFKKCQKADGGHITVYGLAPSQLGNGTPGTSYRDLPFLRSAGDPKAAQDTSAYKTFWALSPDAKTVDGWLNTPEDIQAATWYKGLFDGPDQVTSRTGIPDALINGQACFDLTNARYAQILNTSKITWGASPMPYFKTPIVQTGGITLGVFTKSKHVDAAAKAVVAMSSDPIATDYLKAAHNVPALKSIFPKMGDALNEYPYSIARDEVKEWGQPRPPSTHYTAYNLYVTQALNAIALGGDPKTELDKAVQALDPILAK